MMLVGGTVVTLVLVALAIAWPRLLGSESAWPMLLIAWAMTGAGYAALVTPTGRLLRRSANETDRPALFAAQFSLSHACWLLAYPLAGWLGAGPGLRTAVGTMACLAALGVVTAWRQWPRHDPEAVAHAHPELPSDHPHRHAHALDEDGRHAHPYVIDDLHTRWPSH